MKSPAELEAIARQYAILRGIQVDLQNPLGAGTDGSVWPTNRNSAIKALELEKNYLQELRCYQRLFELKIFRLDGLAIPRLVDFDNSLLVIEMTIVEPPYLLDFGKAYLDESSPYFLTKSFRGISPNWPRTFRKPICPALKRFFGCCGTTG